MSDEERRKFISRYEKSQMTDIERLKYDLDIAKDQLLEFNIDNRGIVDSYSRVLSVLDNEYLTLERLNTYQPHLLILAMWLIDTDLITDTDTYKPLYPIDNDKFRILSKYTNELETLKLEAISTLRYVNLLAQYELSIESI